MKKCALALLLSLMLQSVTYALPFVYSENGKFGLKDKNGKILTEAKFKKVIQLGESAWIIQNGSKFGIMNNEGKIIVDAKYNNAERILGKFAKLSKGEKCGLFDERGMEVLPVEYSSIDLLYGGMFLTCKNYKYGVTDHNGMLILDNVFDDIYMPKPNVMVIVSNGQYFEIEGVKGGELELPVDITSLANNTDFSITELISKPGATTGYYGVTATNYFLKIFSSISPAYEETIDELMFSKGADAAGVILKFSWLPRFPFVYAKKYYQNVTAPNNGPLNNVKTNLKKHLNE